MNDQHVTDVSPWHPSAPANSTESAIRELQNMLVFIMREMDRHGRQIALLESRVTGLERKVDAWRTH